VADTRIYHDTIVLGGNGDLDPARLNTIARATLAVEYPHSRLVSVAWTFATTVDEVEAWPLPHDCDDCRDGKTRAIVALVDGRATVVALGNMTCEEPTDD
jgi:hypothetical protein